MNMGIENEEHAVAVDGGDTVKRVHPIRGLLWGLVFGVGLAGVLVVTATVTLTLLGVIAAVVVGLVVGTLWGVLGPAKAPKGPPPTNKVPVEQVASTRFDDFDQPAEPASAGETDH